MRKGITSMMIGVLLSVGGCGKPIPDDVIPPVKMENVLYDYQRMNNMGDRIPYAENYKKDLLRQSVFEKHKITEARFDSSLVWYTRHATDLAEIYAKLEKRFKRERDDIQRRLNVHSSETEVSLPGDSVDLWRGYRLYLLTDDPINNRIDFTLAGDSNFHARDEFCWEMDFSFIPEWSTKAIMGMNVVYSNDSVIGKTMDIYDSGKHLLCLSCDSAYTVKSVNGFVYLYPNERNKKKGMIVRGIHLNRYHTEADSI
ncbi:DUF4296 domain-containing protein [Phocaeicola abscessus]|uniref:DUF4296 domain-containing protein n=1 Tax=Phocaeicola abscessus TaxID=555313 RepID=UPI0003FA6643|nr:DUF4296 domain-containing protein [Phocaeicola abscessus]